MSRTTGILLTSIVALISVGITSCDRRIQPATSATVPSKGLEVDSSEEIPAGMSNFRNLTDMGTTTEDLRRAEEAFRLWEQQQQENSNQH